MLAQAQADMQAAQRVCIRAEILKGLFLIAERDLRAQLHKLFDAALVADARTDKGNLFALDKILQLFDRQHKYLSPAFFLQQYCGAPPAGRGLHGNALCYYIQNAVVLQQNSARQGGPNRNLFCAYCWPPMGIPCLSSSVRILVIGSMMEETLLSWLMAAMK